MVASVGAPPCAGTARPCMSHPDLSDRRSAVTGVMSTGVTGLVPYRTDRPRQSDIRRGRRSSAAEVPTSTSTVAGFDDPGQLAPDEGRPVGVDLERHVGGRPGFERDSGEAGELFHRAGHLGDHVVQVQLDHLVTRAGTRCF